MIVFHIAHGITAIWPLILLIAVARTISAGAAKQVNVAVCLDMQK